MEVMKEKKFLLRGLLTFFISVAPPIDGLPPPPTEAPPAKPVAPVALGFSTGSRVSQHRGTDETAPGTVREPLRLYDVIHQDS